MASHLVRALVCVSSLWALVACGGDACPCVACGNAVTLSVFDEDGTPLTDWVMDATVNGDPVDDRGACDPGTRATNACNFGTEVGVYHVVVRAPGFLVKELAVRFAAQSGQDCCACLPNQVVNVFMIPEQP